MKKTKEKGPKDPERKVVFLDRDGVLNRDPGGRTGTGYVASPDELEVQPGAAEAIALFHGAGYLVVIISNQQGVGKGLMSEEDLKGVTKRLLGELEKEGGKVTGTYYCTHAASEGCSCRKPLPGLFERAKKDLDLQDIGGYYYIGDTERDIIAGKAAGLRTIAVTSGKSAKNEISAWSETPDMIFEDILEAAGFLTGRGKKRI